MSTLAERIQNHLVRSGNFQIDSLSRSIYATIGQETITNLSKTFYKSVYSEPETELGVMFRNIPMEVAVQNQSEFFVQRFGGPELFNERKGHPALRARHSPFRVTETAAEAWLLHMRKAMKEVLKDADRDVVCALHEFFNHTAYFLINVDSTEASPSS